MRFFSILLILALLFLSSCSSEINVNNSITETTTQEKTTVAPDYNLVFKNNITFYRISRDTFNLFLQNPLHSFLKNSCSSETIINSADVYIRGSSLFDVNDEFIGLFGNSDNLNDYLKQNGYNNEIKNTAIIDSPKIPIIVWIETTKENIFITIDEKHEEKLDDEYTLSIYSQEEFNKQYLKKDGKLLICQKQANPASPAQIYYGYADVVFMDVIYGLNIKSESKNNLIYIYTEKDTYILNQEECLLYEKSDRNKTNLLCQIVGDYYFVYSNNGELIVDSSTLVSVLYGMGIKTSVEIDRDNSTVNIKYR